MVYSSTWESLNLQLRVPKTRTLPIAPQVDEIPPTPRLELGTVRLTAESSTIELCRKEYGRLASRTLKPSQRDFSRVFPSPIGVTFHFCDRLDLNQQPSDFQSEAPPVELPPHLMPDPTYQVFNKG